SAAQDQRATAENFWAHKTAAQYIGAAAWIGARRKLARAPCVLRACAGCCVWSLQARERFLGERLGLLLPRRVRIRAAEADADEAVALQDVERAAHATVDPVGIVAHARDVRGWCAAFLFFLAAPA